MFWLYWKVYSYIINRKDVKTKVYYCRQALGSFQLRKFQHWISDMMSIYASEVRHDHVAVSLFTCCLLTNELNLVCLVVFTVRHAISGDIYHCDGESIVSSVMFETPEGFSQDSLEFPHITINAESKTNLSFIKVSMMSWFVPKHNIDEIL